MGRIGFLKKVSEANEASADGPLVSVVIPTFNEERWIQRAIRQFESLEGNWEIIISDGGSGDRTLELAREFSSVEIVEGGESRASALNLGAERAQGDWILFLHADTQLPLQAYSAIENLNFQEGMVGGAFRTNTIRDHSKSKAFGLLLHLADGRSRYTRYPYGDQALFVRKEVFLKAGGYPEQVLMEDLEFSKKLSKLGKIHRVPASVKVSGRRMEASPLKYCLCINLFPLFYAFGVSPRRLAKFYRPER